MIVFLLLKVLTMCENMCIDFLGIWAIFWLMSYSFLKCMGKSLACLCLDAIFVHFLSVLKKDVKVSDEKTKHPIAMQMTSASILHYNTNFYPTNTDFVLIVLR